MPDALLFKDHTANGLQVHLADCGVDARLARQLQAAVLKHGAQQVPTALEGVSRARLALIASRSRVPRLRCLDRVVSPTDGTTRFLFRGADNALFEAVGIPIVHRPGHEKAIVCVSSQAGCAMGCAFCATGRLGHTRDLETWEMVDQVLSVRADFPWPVRGVVFMGMGEPMLNLDRVLQAAAILNESCGPAIDARAISISTCGVVPGILRLASESVNYRLFVSLVAANEEKRRALMPAARRWPLPELVAALHAWVGQTRRRVLLAWVMMSGVNLGEEDAVALGELTRGLRCLINLIPVNDPSGRFKAPARPELDTFVAALQRHVPQPIVCRYSGGADIGAGCGMLVAGAQPARPSEG